MIEVKLTLYDAEEIDIATRAMHEIRELWESRRCHPAELVPVDPTKPADVEQEFRVVDTGPTTSVLVDRRGEIVGEAHVSGSTEQEEELKVVPREATETELRDALQAYINDKGLPAAKEFLEKAGVKRVTDVAPEDRAAMIAELRS